MAEKNRGISVEKLIDFFKTLGKPGPKTGTADYAGWDQTEAEYRKEQAAWLESVEKRKRKKQTENKSQT